MCWFTLTPAKGKKRPSHSSDSSCAEEIVRVRRDSSPRFSDVRVKIPGNLTVDMDNDHHHHHHHLHPPLRHRHPHLHPHMPHIHPLHLHPIHGHSHHHHHHSQHESHRLHGHGRKRCPSPPIPPPPTRDPSRHHSPPRSPSKCRTPTQHPEPIYRTQIIEPTSVRGTTRLALRTVESERPRGRLRRVAGYEVLGREVPWNWDCVSSTVGSSTAAGGVRWVRRKGKSASIIKYPPFGGPERWL
ncbi:hypothetical protein ACN47E_008695 [Coniothyrium glycines]